MNKTSNTIMLNREEETLTMFIAENENGEFRFEKSHVDKDGIQTGRVVQPWNRHSGAYESLAFELLSCVENGWNAISVENIKLEFGD